MFVHKEFSTSPFFLNAAELTWKEWFVCSSLSSQPARQQKLLLVLLSRPSRRLSAAFLLVLLRLFMHACNLACDVAPRTGSQVGCQDQVPRLLPPTKNRGHRGLVGGRLRRGCRPQKRSTRTSLGSWVSTWNGTPVLLNKSHYRQDYTLAITFSLSDIKGRSLINK